MKPCMADDVDAALDVGDEVHRDWRPDADCRSAAARSSRRGGAIDADIAIEDERICGRRPGACRAARAEIDARGLTVLPALIDVHLHFNEPGRADWEGAATGSRALAAGGGTLFFDMPLNSTPCTVDAHEFDRQARGAGSRVRSPISRCGAASMPGNVGELAELAERGVDRVQSLHVRFRACPNFRAPTISRCYEGMREAARLGLPVAVHAESEEITKALTRRMLRPAARMSRRSSNRGRLSPKWKPSTARRCSRARPAANCTSCTSVPARGVAAALEARARGADISIETCPHYLLFTEDDLLRIGAVAKCAPPLRSAAERRALWTAVLRGEVDMVASDHSPCAARHEAAREFFRHLGRHRRRAVDAAACSIDHTG